MSMTAGFVYLFEKIPSIWDWIPIVVQEKYDCLKTLYDDQKMIREKELAVAEEPVIPCIGW